MGFDDGAQALFFGGEELLEKPFASLSGDSATVVAHAYANRFVAAVFGGDFHLALGLRDIAHRVKGASVRPFSESPTTP